MQQVANTWDARLYNDKHAFVYDYGLGLIDLLAPKPNERILDLGCGSGELTVKINELAKSAVGIDKSPEMIARAQEQFPLDEFHVADACDFGLGKPFDAIFSNATLHWVTDYKAAIANMYNNLKDGGRMVVEFGGKDNVGAITDALRKALLRRGYKAQSELGLWYFPSIGEYTSELEAQGFRVTFTQWYERPTELVDSENGIKDWLSMFAKPFFKGLNEKEKEAILIETQENLRPTLFQNDKWHADYKRIRVVAYK